MTPWITKPIPFNIGQGAAAAAVPSTTDTCNSPETCGGNCDDTAMNGDPTSAGNTRSGEQFNAGADIIGETIVGCKFQLKVDSVTGAPGSIKLNAYNSAGVLQTSIAELANTELTTSFQFLTFTRIGSASHTVVAGDRIVLEIPSTFYTGGYNQWTRNRYTNDSSGWSNATWTTYSINTSTWTEYGTYDITGCFTYED